MDVLLSLSLLSLSILHGARSATFTVTNNCGYTIWPGILSNAGLPPLSTTGFQLSSGESRAVDVPPSWSGRVWARTVCAGSGSARFSCATGDCGTGTVECGGAGAAPPVTLAEFTLNGGGNNDFYDVSLVDGYNLPVVVVPQGGVRGPNCWPTGCVVDLNGPCPPELRVIAGGQAVACRSACEAFGDPKYCCSGAYANPNTCGPSSYSQFFKNACPRAYSYAYDDSTSTFTCAAAGSGGGGAGGATGYLVAFCPSMASLKSSGGNNPEAAGLPLMNNTMVFSGGAGEPSNAVRTSSIFFAFSLLVLSLSTFL